MENEFEKIELYEKDGKGKLRIDGKTIKSVTGYNIRRGTDTVNVTFNMSVPISNFKTITKE